MLDPSPESWRPVVGYEGIYSASNRGRIFSHVSNRFMSQTVRRPSGHLVLSMTKDSVSKTMYVHRVVLEAWDGPAPEGMMVCHYDGEPTNNDVTNLRWGTPKDNADDGRRLGEHPKKATCIRGHEFTPENSVYPPNRGRQCRICQNAASRKYRAAKKMKAA